MDILALLRDPMWQAIGAGLTAVSIVVALLLSANFRQWIMNLARRLGTLVVSLLGMYGTKTLLFATAFILPILWTKEIVSSIVFSVLIISLFIEPRVHKTGLLLFTKIALPVLALAYVLPKILIFRDELRYWIPSVFFSLEAHLLIMILVFGIMQDIRASVKTIEHRRHWSEPLWEHQKQTAEQLSKITSSLDEAVLSLRQLSTRVSHFQIGQTPQEKPPPQWWQVLEAIKAKELSFTGLSRRSNEYKATVNYYDIVIKCGHRIDRDACTLTIIFPNDFVYPLYYDDEKGYVQKIANDIVIEAGHTFEGYAVNWTIQK